MGFSRRSLPIGEDRAVITIDELIDDLSHRTIVYIFLACRWLENSVEHEVCFLGSPLRVFILIDMRDDPVVAFWEFYGHSTSRLEFAPVERPDPTECQDPARLVLLRGLLDYLLLAFHCGLYYDIWPTKDKYYLIKTKCYLLLFNSIVLSFFEKYNVNLFKYNCIM